VTWEDKTPTRLPEAFWLRWAPRSDAVNASSWLMYKLGQPISPLEVMLNGSHALHAVGDEGVSVDSADGSQRLYIRQAQVQARRGCSFSCTVKWSNGEACTATTAGKLP
jgi:hypothetical protein